MNKRKQRQEKLHDSLINILYAPPLPPSSNHNQFDEQTLNLAREIINSDHHHHINTDELETEEEEEERGLNEEDGDGGLGFQKLTRAQRKRLRKKKLKQSVSERRDIIGPELPAHSEGVRRNASERPETGNDHNHSKTLHDESPSCIKVKQRRMTKKKAMERPKIPSADINLAIDDQN